MSLSSPGTLSDDDQSIEDEEDVAEVAGRAGLAVRGIIYLISAVLTVRIATGDSGEEGPGKSGALRAVAEQPFGRFALVVLAVGLLGYAIWRVIAAVKYEPDQDEPRVKGLAKRAGYIGRAGVYLIGFSTAISLILSGSSSSGGSGDGEQTARVLGLPFGRYLVLGAGLGVLSAAVYNAYRAVTRNYRDKWDENFSPQERRLATWISSAGLLGHMLVFALVGFFVTRAAIEFDPNEPEGLDQAAKEIADASWGTSVLVLLAFGMVAYALFSFIEARWRRLLD